MEKYKEFSREGFTRVAGKIEQIGVGNIQEFDDHVEVECLAGGTKEALLDAMQKIADKARKPVKSSFQGIAYLVEPNK